MCRCDEACVQHFRNRSRPASLAAVIGTREVDGVPAVTLQRRRRHRCHLRPRRGDGGELALPPGRGTAGAARRFARVYREALDDGNPTAAPLGESHRPRPVPGRRGRGQPGAGTDGEARSQRAPHARPALSAGGWRVNRHEATADGGVLAASFDFAGQRDLLTAFPFPHELRFDATWRARPSRSRRP